MLVHVKSGVHKYAHTCDFGAYAVRQCAAVCYRSEGLSAPPWTGAGPTLRSQAMCCAGGARGSPLGVHTYAPGATLAPQASKGSMKKYLAILSLACAVAACIKVIPATTQAGLSECCDRKPPCPTCPVCPDGGTEPPPDAGTTPPPSARGWLHTNGNGIYDGFNQRWQGRGVNVPDTRSCNACAYEPPNVGEVLRRIDEAVSWGATLIRLDLESYSAADWRVHWQDVLHDPAYLSDIQAIAAHVASLPGVYVEVSLWIDPSLDARGWPTQATIPIWQALVGALAANPRVIFGIANEPTDNYGGADDATVRSRYRAVVDAIRAEETRLGARQHLVAVQGCGGWARLLSCWVGHELGSNIVYETHIYNPESDFQNLVTTPAQTLPVIIGEFGEAPGYMTLSDTQALMNLGDSLKIPWTAWVFHHRCPPNLLIDNSGGGCGAGMALQPTSFGSQVKAALGGP